MNKQNVIRKKEKTEEEMQPQMAQSRRQGLKGKPVLLFYSTSRKETFCWKWWGLRKGNWRGTVEM